MQGSSLRPRVSGLPSPTPSRLASTFSRHLCRSPFTLNLRRNSAVAAGGAGRCSCTRAPSLPHAAALRLACAPTPQQHQQRVPARPLSAAATSARHGRGGVEEAAGTGASGDGGAGAGGQGGAVGRVEDRELDVEASESYLSVSLWLLWYPCMVMMAHGQVSA